MNFGNEEQFETYQPYSKMLRRYEQTVSALKERRTALRAELRTLLQRKTGTHESARAQVLLEKRIQMLYDEYLDLMDAIREIRIYAEREGN